MNQKFFLIISLALTVGLAVKAQPFTGVPVLNSPGDKSIVSSFPVYLSWNQVEGANAGYEYQVLDTSGGGGGTKGRVFGQSVTSVKIDANAFSMGYIHQWSVRACAGFPSTLLGPDGECGGWADFRSFTPILSKPSLSLPTDGSLADVLPLELKWQEVSGAAKYQYFVGTAKSADGKTVQNIVSGGTGEVLANKTLATFNLPVSSIGQIHYWQIVVIPGKGKQSISDVWSFKARYPKPKGISPQSEVIYQEPFKLEWQVTVPAEQYLWYILDENGLSFLEGESASSPADVKFNLNYLDKPLKWIVQACKTGRQYCSQPSDPLSFKVVLGKPTITEPGTNGQVIAAKTSNNYLFSWTGVAGAGYYHYEIPGAKIPTSGDIPGAGPVGASFNAYVPETNLSRGSSYTFKVQTCSLNEGIYHCSPFSERTFTTASLNITPFYLSPSSGPAPLSVQMTASVSGYATKDATINYNFYCDQSSDSKTISGTVSGTDYKKGDYLKQEDKIIGYKIDGVKETSFTIPADKKICKDIYTVAKTYTPKVIVERDAAYLTKEKTTTITVGSPTFSGELTGPKTDVYTTQPYALKVKVSGPAGFTFKVGLAGSDPAVIYKDKDCPIPSGGASCLVEWEDKKSAAGTYNHQANIKYFVGSETKPEKTVYTNSLSVKVIAPTVDIRANGQRSSITIPYNSSVTLSWTTNLTECQASGAWSGSKAVPGGSETKSNLAPSQTYTLTCSPVTTKDSVVVVVGLPTCSQLSGNWCPQGFSCEGGRIDGGLLDKANFPDKICCLGACKPPPAPSTPAPAPAKPACPDPCAGLPKGTVCIQNPLCAKGFEDIVNNIINFIFKIAIVLGPLMIVIGGVLFLTSAGDLTRISQAKKLILFTGVGLLVIIMAKGIIALIQALLGVK